MYINLSGLNILVTGASRGIGKEIASILNQEECIVILNARTRNKLKSASVSLGSENIFFPADVTKSQDCKKLLKFIQKKFGRFQS